MEAKYWAFAFAVLFLSISSCTMARDYSNGKVRIAQINQTNCEKFNEQYNTAN